MNLAQKVAVNTTLLMLGRLLVAASGLVGVVISTRYLGRDAYGMLTVALVFTGLFGFLADSGLWTVAAREMARRPDEESRIFANVFTIGVLLSLLTLLLSLVTMVLLYGGAGRGLVREAILILSLQVLVTAAGGSSSAYMTAHQLAVPAALAALVSSLLFVAVLGLVAAFDLGFVGFATAFSLTGIVNVGVYSTYVFRRIRPRLTYDARLWRQVASWAIPQGGVLILGALYFRIDLVLLSILKPDREVALYGLAYKLIEVGMLVPAFLMQTIFPEIARAQPHSRRLWELVQGAFSTSLVLIVPLVVLALGFAPEAVIVAGGPRFAAATGVLQLLAVALAVVYLNTVFFHSLVALNQQGRLFRLLLVVLGGNIALNVVLIPPLGAAGAAWAMVASELVMLGLAARAFRRVGEIPRVPRIARLTAAALLTALAVFVLRGLSVPTAGASHGLLGFDGVSALVTLVVGSAAALGVYVAALHLLDALPVELRSALANLRPRRQAESATVASPAAPSAPFGSAAAGGGGPGVPAEAGATLDAVGDRRPGR